MNSSYTLRAQSLFIYSVVALLVLAGIVALSPSYASAVGVSCSINRNLEVGSIGEDVRCLQKFLNANGFKVAMFGAGSPGLETDTFGGLTKAALINWQASKGLFPATGHFGAGSLVKFQLEGTAPLAPSTVTPVAPPGMTMTPIVPVVTSSAAQTTLDQIKKALEAIKSARDGIEDAEDAIDEAKDDDADSDDIEDAEDDLQDAKDSYESAIVSLIDGDYKDSYELAQDAIDFADTAADVEGGSGDEEDDAQEALDDADSAIDDAEDAIQDAEDDGDDVDEARDLLDDAEKKYDKAQDAFDDEDYDEAIDLANDARELAEEAEDAL